MLITVLSAGPDGAASYLAPRMHRRKNIMKTPAISGPCQSPTPVFVASTPTRSSMSPAVIDSGETVLGTRNFPTTRAGYRAMLSWIGQSGELARTGVEGTGSYGAGLTHDASRRPVP